MMALDTRNQSQNEIDQSLNVLYLTWGEVIVQDGIFDNQVLEQLKLLRQVDPALSLSLLSGMPLVNRPLLKTRQLFYRDLQRIESQMAAAQIAFDYRWIPAVARWFHSQPYHFPFYSLGQLRYLRHIITTREIKIVHCRGYHAARVALLAKERYHLRCAVLFDTRGIFPEEGVFAGHFTQESPAYCFWKQLEKWLLDRADAVVNVSDTFTTHVRTLTANEPIATIYTSANLDLFQRKVPPPVIGPAAQLGPDEQLTVRQRLGIGDETKVLVYSGSIGINQGWHRVNNLVALYQAFQQTFAQAKLLIITRSPHAPLCSALDSIPAIQSQYLLVAGNSPQETAAYLQAADYAALPYREVGSPIEERIGYTMVASKTGEYFAVGLPLLVNRAVGAATKLVEDHGIGCAYTAGEEIAMIEPLRTLDANYGVISERAVDIAHTYFSAAGNAKKYLALYRQLYDQQVKS